MNTTTTLTKESVAALLNGREYGDELPEGLEPQLKAAGLVVAFGYSDDNMELRGAIHDEVGCFDGRTFKIDREGVMPEWERGEAKEFEDAREFFRRDKNPFSLLAIKWHDTGNPCWTFDTKLEHATFDIMEGDEKFCQGIVFSLEDLK